MESVEKRKQKNDDDANNKYLGSRSPAPGDDDRRPSRHHKSSRRRSRSDSRSRSRDRDRRSSRRHRSRSRDRHHGHTRSPSDDRHHHHHSNRRRRHAADESPESGEYFDEYDEEPYAQPASSHYQQPHYSQHDDRFGYGGSGYSQRGYSRGGRRDPRTDDSSGDDDTQSNGSFDEQRADDYRNQTPSHKIIIFGLPPFVTEADITNDLVHYGLNAVSVRLIRRRKTGVSRGFAFVEFDTQEDATRWMEYKQGILMTGTHNRSIMQYSNARCDASGRIATDWFCGKCGIFNFKRRDNCYKCFASREESEKGGEGSDEVSEALTKKILLRNLDVLTNEEGVLTHLQRVLPDLVARITQIQICRDPLTSTSRGICYLSFANLVDSMEMHNGLKSLEPPLQMDERDIVITYCTEPGSEPVRDANGWPSKYGARKTAADDDSADVLYTLDDVPMLADYSAGVYASNAAEHEHYRKYYTEYYTTEIQAGNFAGLPKIPASASKQAMAMAAEAAAVKAAKKYGAPSSNAAAAALEVAAARSAATEANSGAAVALSAIQRKQQMHTSTAAVVAAAPVLPTGRDNRVYPAPNTALFQYDEQSQYYYDPTTGLYYDAQSQYYYNSVSGEYMYWDAARSTYTIAQSTGVESKSSKRHKEEKHAKAGGKSKPAVAAAADEIGDEPPVAGSSDKVKVAKKIVKDMERWAKQLNQKKDQIYMPEAPAPQQPQQVSAGQQRGGYADVGFSILGGREQRPTVGGALSAAATLAAVHKPATTLAAAAHYDSDSEGEAPMAAFRNPDKPAAVVAVSAAVGAPADSDPLVDFDRLTCLLCKRAFGSAEVLMKHVQMSQLHKDNLRKLGEATLSAGASAHADDSDAAGGGLSYRDRAKERRLKYGEPEPPPVAQRGRELAKQHMQQMQQQQHQQQQQQEGKKRATEPIGQNNVGNRLLQKMGWQEGQGLGKANQGRTNIIETESRSATAGLGSKSTAFVPGDDYKTYIRRMMKARYEQAED